MVLYPAVSLVSINPEGSHDHSARDARAVAQGRLSLLLRWKSRRRGGRPQIETELRVLIRRMSIENPLWGAPRIHGELLKLGFDIAQSSVAKYMVKRRGPPGQGWRTFLRNHVQDIAAMDLFVVPTIYGAVVTRRLRAMGIRDRPMTPASPWQNGFAERLIGSIRRESVNHMIVLGEAHLRRSLKSYAQYDDGVRTHRSLNKDALEHDPEKWVPVFRKRSCSNNKLERYDDSS